MHRRLNTRLGLGPHIDLRRRVLANQHHREPGYDPLGAEERRLGRNLLANLGANGRSVDEPSAHFAISEARVSRITVTRIWPGYCNSLSIRRAMVSESVWAAVSVICSGFTMTRTSRPA